MNISIILESKGTEVLNYIKSHVDIDSHSTIVQKNNDEFNVRNLRENNLSTFININKMNDVRRINKLLAAVNDKLVIGGTFIGYLETLEERRRRLLTKYPPIFNIIYYIFDFIVKRIFSKLYFTRRLYLFITADRNKAISKAEMLGRLVFCGFSIENIKVINNNLYFTAIKIGLPHVGKIPSYGSLFSMYRIGHYGKKIKVYKIRTMHRYAEYIQEYVYQENKLCKGGKFKDDFRITKWGRILRAFWIDEIPMIVNLIAGQLKVVGVRPLSEHYLKLYSNELREKRSQYKPGLIPPFYADLPQTLSEIMESEIKYIDSYRKNPFKTDVIYFFKALNNIFLKKARSR